MQKALEAGRQAVCLLMVSYHSEFEIWFSEQRILNTEELKGKVDSHLAESRCTEKRAFAIQDPQDSE